MTADQLLGAYATRVYHQSGSYQGTARRLAIDGRIVKSRVNSRLLEKFREQPG